MRQWWQFVSRGTATLSIACALAACSTAKPPAPATPETGKPPVEAIIPQADETRVPTVPPATPTPVPTAAPLSTRPIGRDDVKASKDRPIGPIITHFGAARADGLPVKPTSIDGGIPTYVAAAGSGFMLVIEAKPGLSNHEVGRRVFVSQPDDPTVRPDLEIISDKNMGDGSPRICDRMRPDIGGIPAAKSFAETQQITDAINDLSCRFETFNESESACTVTENGDFSFVNKDTTQQFCMIVARAWGFPVGDTILTVRVRDIKGNVGPSKRIRIRRPVQVAPPPTSPPAAPTPSGPKPLPTRGM